MTPAPAGTIVELVHRIKDPHVLIEAVVEMIEHVGENVKEAIGVFTPFPETEEILSIAHSWLRGERAVGATCGDTSSLTNKKHSAHGRYIQQVQYDAASQLARMFGAISEGRLDLTEKVLSAAEACRRAVVPATRDEGIRQAERAWQIDYLESLLWPTSSSIPEGRLRNSTLTMELD